MSRKYWTKDEEEFLRQKAATMSPRELADCFGVSYHAITSKANKIGVNFKSLSGELWSEAEDTILREKFEWAAQGTLKKMLPGRTWPGILQRGIKTNNLNRLSQDRYAINHLFMDKWTEKSAYFFGFVAADGHLLRKGGIDNITSIQFELAEKDMDILEKIKEALEAEAPIGKSKRHTCKFYVSNARIFNKLIELGIPEIDKTHQMKWPSKLPDEYYAPFIRGVFDGDGSVWFSENSLRSYFMGTYDLLEGIKKALPFSTDTISITYRGNSPKGADVYVFKLASQNTLRLYEWMYADATIFSERKRKKFEACITAWKTRKAKRRVIRDIIHKSDSETNE